MSDATVKDAVRQRDGYRCVDCGKAREGRALDVHRLVPGSAYTLEGCVTVCRGCHRKRHSKPKRENKLVSVKMQDCVWRMIRTVASWRGVNSSDLITELARENAELAFNRMQKEIAESIGSN